MAIEATGILAESTHAHRVSAEQNRPERSASRRNDEIGPERSDRDRFEHSRSGRSRRFLERFRRLSSEAFERPDKKHGIVRELKQQFRKALRTLKEAGALDKHEFKALRKAFRHALKAAASTDVASTELSREASVEQSRRVSIDIRTAEGDSVQIRLQRKTSVDESVRISSDGENGTSIRTQRTVARQSALSFTVEGDLNDDERAAIADLVARVDQLAVRFFDGDVQAALEHAQEFGLPDEEIAAFSVDLAYSMEARAITAYREVGALAAPAEKTGASAADDLFADVRELANSVRLQTLFAESRRLVFDFVRGAVGIDMPTGIETDANAPPVAELASREV
ncbi:MAG: hypothetical protein GY716_23130 [bacterium]|nr:hypothetical protein [bacterium]